MGYSFELLTDDFSARHIRDTVATLEARMTEGWPSWSISNHDVQRVVTRWGGAQPDARLAPMLCALAASLRGSVCVYQGEELGLPEAEVPFELLQDPYGISFWPNFKGRDGCRTPMPWNNATHAGFTTGTPWLPVADSHRSRNIAAQSADPDSTLNQYRRFLHWRANQPALVDGDIHLLDSAEPVLAFTRTCAAQTLLCVFNLSAEPQSFTLPEALSLVFEDASFAEPIREADTITLPAFGACFLR
jgi:alpha-glucosidase